MEENITRRICDMCQIEGCQIRLDETDYCFICLEKCAVWKKAQEEIKDRLRLVLDNGGTSQSFIEDLEELLEQD